VEKVCGGAADVSIFIYGLIMSYSAETILIWKEFAEANNGKINFRKTAWGPFGMNSWEKLVMTIPLQKGSVDFSVSEASSVEAKYTVNNLDFGDFNMYRKDVFDKISEWRGKNTSAVSNIEFNSVFIIKSKSKEKTNKLFTDTVIKNILYLKRMLTLIRGEKSKSITIKIPGSAGSYKHIQAVFEIFKEMEVIIIENQ